MSTQSTAKIEHQLAEWRRDLINLDRRNRLLFYKPTLASTVELVEPNPADILGRLLHPSAKGIRVVPAASSELELVQDAISTARPKAGPLEAVATEANPVKLFRILLNIERRASQILPGQRHLDPFSGTGHA